jgi:hypothetical protein
VRHRQSQICGFARRHAVEQNRHRKRRGLIIGNIPVRKAAYEELDLFEGQFVSVTFLDNDIYSAHGATPGYVTLREHWLRPKSLLIMMIEILRFAHTVPKAVSLREDDISEKVFDVILSHLRNRKQVDKETGNQ